MFRIYYITATDGRINDIFILAWITLLQIVLVWEEEREGDSETKIYSPNYFLEVKWE